MGGLDINDLHDPLHPINLPSQLVSGQNGKSIYYIILILNKSSYVLYCLIHQVKEASIQFTKPSRLLIYTI